LNLRAADLAPVGKGTLRQHMGHTAVADFVRR
jgi:hypothetical protein